jgi:hypothetical protein
MSKTDKPLEKMVECYQKICNKKLNKEEIFS